MAARSLPLVPLSVPAVLEPEPSLADLITCRDARTLERAAQQVFPVFCFQLLDLFNALNSARQLVRRSFLFFLLHVVGKCLVTPREEQLLQLLRLGVLQPLLQALPPEVGGYLLPLAPDPATAAKLRALGCQPSQSVPPPRSAGDLTLIALLQGDAAEGQRLLPTADLDSVDLVFVLEEFLLRRLPLAPHLPPECWDLHAVAPAWVLTAALLHAGLTNNAEAASLLLTLTRCPSCAPSGWPPACCSCSQMSPPCCNPTCKVSPWP